MDVRGSARQAEPQQLKHTSLLRSDPLDKLEQITFRILEIGPVPQ
jgi:hypothetical protein